MCTIKVQVPRPVRVVVPPTTLELFLDVIHQVLQIQVVPVVHNGFLHKLSQSITSLIRVEEAQDCYGQLGEEDQCQAEGEL